MRNHNELLPRGEDEFLEEEIPEEEFGQDWEEEEASLINWRLIGTIILSTILIISIIFGLIGPALIQPDVQIIIPTATPTPDPFLIGFGF